MREKKEDETENEASAKCKFIEDATTNTHGGTAAGVAKKNSKNTNQESKNGTDGNY